MTAAETRGTESARRYGSHRAMINADMHEAADLLDLAADTIERLAPRRFPNGTKQDGQDRNTATRSRLQAHDLRELLEALRVPGPTDPPPDRGHQRGISSADQENARMRDERAASADGLTAAERAMSRHPGRGACGGTLPNPDARTF